MPILSTLALTLLAAAADPDAQYARKDFAGCATSYLELAKSQVTPKREEALYNAACCQARAGLAKNAVETLRTAFAGAETEHRMESLEGLDADEDLATLKNDPAWLALKADTAARVKAFRARQNAELEALVRADQKDRSSPGINWKDVAPRDAARFERVRAIVKAKGAKTADDYFNAALVMQHGQGEDAIAEAHALALSAVKLDPTYGKAKWLAAASEDRLLVRQKKLQKYATQYGRKGDLWVLEPVDPSITDEERARWNVPPLKEAQARLAVMNAKRK